MTLVNRRWVVAAYPEGLPKLTDFRLETAEVPALRDGEVLVKVLYVSMDPGQRFYISRASGAEPLDQTVKAWGVGRVVESRSARFPVGSHVRDQQGECGVQLYSAISEQDLTPVDADLPLPLHLGALGMVGQTAYFGMLAVGALKEGEAILVTGASGAVGAIAGQIARIKGCRVIGVTGSAAKARHLVSELGFDEAVDTSSDDLCARLTALCPSGFDLFFDNVGGPLLDKCILHMKRHGRIVSCGAASQYNNVGSWPGLQNYFEVGTRQLRFEGFYVGDYLDQFDKATKDLAHWIRSGDLRHEEDVRSGFETFPDIFLALFTETRSGKLVLQLQDDEIWQQKPE